MAWSPPVALAAALSAAALAGCVGHSGPVTAQALLPSAAASARDWDAGAQLVAVFAVEARDVQAYAAPGLGYADHAAQVDALAFDHDDAHVGDGRATVWRFTFQAGSEVRDVIATAKDGIVRGEPGIGRGRPLGDWTLDSDAAWAALARSGGFGGAVPGAPSLAEQILVGTTGPHAAWFLSVQSGNRTAEAMVDAVDGSVHTDFAAIAAALALPPFVHAEKGSWDPQMTAAAPTASQAWALDAPMHPTLEVSLGASAAAPTTRVTLTLQAPDGRTLTLEHTVASPGDGARDHLEVPQPPPGTYNATVTLDGPGPLANVHVAWCAAGETDPC